MACIEHCAIANATKCYRRRVNKWRSYHHAPCMRGRRYHQPHHKPHFMAPTAQFHSTLSKFADNVDHATDILPSSPRFQPKSAARCPGKVRGDHHCQYSHAVHRTYLCHTPEHHYAPWIQKLTTTVCCSPFIIL